MKYFVMLLASCMVMTACSSKNDGGSTPGATGGHTQDTATFVDVSKLSDESGDLYADVDTQIDFGTVTASTTDKV